MAEVTTIFPTWGLFAAGCVILFIGTTVHIGFGFGGGMIAVGGLAMLLPDLQDVVVVLLLVAVPLETVLVILLRRSLRARPVIIGAVAMGLGVPVGAWLLAHGAPAYLLPILGVLLLLFGIAFLVLPHGVGRTWSDASMAPAGLFAGIVSGLFGVGGPPLALYAQLRGLDKATFRANLITIFYLSNLVRLPSYYGQGLVNEARLWSALLIVPALVLGGVAGNVLHQRLSETAFHRWVSVAVALIGVLLAARAVL